MSRPRGDERKSLIIALTLLGCLVFGVILLWQTGYLEPFVRRLIAIFSSRDDLRAYVESWGVWAPAAFIAIQILQVLLAPIPGEFTGAVGGFAFGAVPTILYSTIGLTVGSVLAFGAARIIGLPIVRVFVTERSFRKFGFLTKRKGVLLALVLFTIPGFPKDMLSYLLGLSPIRFSHFLLACTLGRIPGTVMLSISGSALFSKNWMILGVMTLLCTTLFLLLYVYRDRIEVWLRGAKTTEEP